MERPPSLTLEDLGTFTSQGAGPNPFLVVSLDIVPCLDGKSFRQPSFRCCGTQHSELPRWLRFKGPATREDVNHALFVHFVQATELCRIAKRACHCTIQCSEEIQGQGWCKVLQLIPSSPGKRRCHNFAIFLLFLGARRRDVAEQLAPTHKSKVCFVQIVCPSRGTVPCPGIKPHSLPRVSGGGSNFFAVVTVRRNAFAEVPFQKADHILVAVR